ncbi:MAG: FadR/GntR family transcriptional regulator [Eubacteriales bacterium]|nr:FadR/GntR family transcriptional regulator [Eubacteriales bacterium]
MKLRGNYMQAIEKVSVVQQAENQIKKFILNDSVKIGDKLPPEKIFCEELGIGRGSVREALRLLQAKGLVEVIQGKGAFVARKEEIKKEELAGWFRDNEIELKDFNEVRMAIEPLAIRFAIERCTEKEFQRLQEIHAKAVEAAERRDSAELAIYDEKFHTCIIECSHNKLLMSINKEIVKSLKRFRERTFHIESNIQNCIPFHTAILEAFGNKDVELAQRKLLEHLECVETDLESSKNLAEKNE